MEKRSFLERWALPVAILGMFIGLTLLLVIPSEPIADYVISAGYILFLGLNGWLVSSGLTRKYREWDRFWYLYLVPFLIVGVMNLVEYDWAGLQFSGMNAARWLINNLGVGLFEEMMMRGFVLYLLYRAWGRTRKGLIWACIIQAVLFGALHFSNLMQGADFLSVLSQVIYSSFIGLAFGGMALITRSLIPGIVVHGLIDAFGAMDVYFGTSASDLPEAAGAGELLMQVGTVFVLFVPAM